MTPPLVDRDPLDEERAGQLILEANERIEPLVNFMQRFAVASGTSLAGDDSATAYDPLSNQVRSLLSVALDNMQAFSALLIRAEVLPAFAGHALMRNALEGAGLSLWLLGPTARDERVIRALQNSYESRFDLHTLHAEIHDTAFVRPDTGDRVYDRLAELRDARPNLAGRSLRPQAISKRLALAEPHVTRQSEDQLRLVTLWRITSGITHGRRDIIWQVIDGELASTTSTGAEMRMTAGVSQVASFFVATVNYLQDGVRLLQERNTAR